MTADSAMDSARSEEKAKPFRLVKYFAFSSLTVIFAGTIVLAMLNTHWASSMQRKKSEEYARLLVENLNHQIFMQFIIPVALKYGKIQLRNQSQFERMDKVVRSTIHSFKVERLNIYDKNNIISYSLAREHVGKKNLGGTDYQRAVAGETTSTLIQRGSFWQILLGLPKETHIVTFAPLHAEKPLTRISGPIIGVVEIAQNLTEDYQTIHRYQILVILTCSAVMAVLFVVMIAVVRRGEKIIEKRAMEKMRLKEKLDKAKHLSSLGEMTARISHEIRNPLGIITSSAEHLKKKMALSDPQSTIADIIVEEAGRLNDIISDFLNYARPRTPNLIPCRVEDILEKNLNFLASQIETGGYVIDKDYGHDLPEIAADPNMLYQAFLNILINAMQALPNGGEIQIRTIAMTEGVRILFEDAGEGIPEEVLKQIWDPFFTTKEKGTGLGLGIVKNIIDSHGGSVHIENRRAQPGTRVIVYLPKKKAA